MTRLGHLEKVDVKLTVETPTYVGSGKQITKKEYIYIPKEERVYIPDFSKFISFIEKRNLINQYQTYMEKNYEDLKKFCDNNNIAKNEYKEFIEYSLSAKDALDEEHSISGIETFMRDGRNVPYIPGSSIKGALRTVILHKFILRDNNVSKLLGNIQEEVNKARKLNNKLLSRDIANLEAKYLNKLSFKDRIEEPVNSIMRGIMVSDSSDIDVNDLILCKKIDITKSGKINRLNILRECIKPLTQISFSITLEEPILRKSGVDIEFIKEAISEFAKYYAKNYESKFVLEGAEFNKCTKPNIIHIGGGTGYQTKSVISAIGGEEYSREQLYLVSSIMKLGFRNHYHESDRRAGVSPHTIKYTKYNGAYYPMGKCSLEFIL